MCGRFSLPVGDRDIAFEWDVELSKLGWKPRYNIAPTQNVLTIRNDPEKGLVAEAMRWQYIPSYFKEVPKISTINARGDKILNAKEKSMFRNAFQHRRALILAGGFFEWQKEITTELVKKKRKKDGEVIEEEIEKEKIIKHPYFIHLKERKVFGLAGIWEDWKSPQGEQMRTCAIVTTEPNKLMKPIHDRMPVIVRKADEQLWLNTDVHELNELAHVLEPYSADEMLAYEVGKAVGSPSFDSPDCVKPV